MPYTKEQKEQIEAVTRTLLQKTAFFCGQYLDEECCSLAQQVILKMKRKRVVPFLSGNPNVWAAAIIYALGQINCLFDQASQPYVSPADITKHFGAAQSTVGQKAKVIRDMLGMEPYHPDYSTSTMLESSPFKDMVMVNGFIVPTRLLTPED